MNSIKDRASVIAEQAQRLGKPVYKEGAFKDTTFRAELESEQKEAHFNEVYAEWQKSAKSFSVKGAFTNLPLPNSAD